ncbi:hypothetical protein HK102_008679 [Quaeritorhiza haematococci]|nr:hypothetical protein HK102_008679 [Quaeritorhiza haematococci]
MESISHVAVVASLGDASARFLIPLFGGQRTIEQYQNLETSLVKDAVAGTLNVQEPSDRELLELMIRRLFCIPKSKNVALECSLRGVDLEENVEKGGHMTNSATEANEEPSLRVHVLVHDQEIGNGMNMGELLAADAHKQTKSKLELSPFFSLDLPPFAGSETESELMEDDDESKGDESVILFDYEPLPDSEDERELEQEDGRLESEPVCCDIHHDTSVVRDHQAVTGLWERHIFLAVEHDEQCENLLEEANSSQHVALETTATQTDFHTPAAAATADTTAQTDSSSIGMLEQHCQTVVTGEKVNAILQKMNSKVPRQRHMDTAETVAQVSQTDFTPVKTMAQQIQTDALKSNAQTAQTDSTSVNTAAQHIQTDAMNTAAQVVQTESSTVILVTQHIQTDSSKSTARTVQTESTAVETVAQQIQTEALKSEGQMVQTVAQATETAAQHIQTDAPKTVAQVVQTESTAIIAHTIQTESNKMEMITRNTQTEDPSTYLVDKTHSPTPILNPDFDAVDSLPSPTSLNGDDEFVMVNDE